MPTVSLELSKEIINPSEVFYSLTKKGFPKKNDIDLFKKWIDFFTKNYNQDRLYNDPDVYDDICCHIYDLVGKDIFLLHWQKIWNKSIFSLINCLNMNNKTMRYSSRCFFIAYFSSFFNGTKFEFDLSPAIELWNKGLIPLFDGVSWQLFKADVSKPIYKIKVN